jgi:hypothetical protein
MSREWIKNIDKLYARVPKLDTENSNSTIKTTEPVSPPKKQACQQPCSSLIQPKPETVEPAAPEILIADQIDKDEDFKYVEEMKPQFINRLIKTAKVLF